MTQTTWDTDDFESMSWHDNHVHGIQLLNGEYGAGEIHLDLDHILEWRKSETGEIQFIIAPATLIFHEITDFRISIDYKTAGAAMGAFSIDGITRRSEDRERYTATIWTIPVNFPDGEIEFEAAGFSQSLRSAPITCGKQWLTSHERNPEGRS